MIRTRFRTRAELERRIDAAKQLRAATLADASRNSFATAGAALRRLLVRIHALGPRRAWWPLAPGRRASGTEGPSI